MQNERYYYRLLTPAEKDAYRKIYEGIKMRALNIVVDVHLPHQYVQEIYLRVLFDNPMFYYINQTVIRMMGQSGNYLLMPEYLCSMQEIERINRQIFAVMAKIDRKARTLMSDPFRLEKYLHDSIVKSVAYDYESLKRNDCYNAHSIVGALLDRKAVCEGIAKAFKLLCNAYNMKCIVVLGKADPAGRFDGDTYHAWNLVKVGGQSYHVDPTWDNMYENGLQHISYDYFNVTTEDILRDHRPMAELPQCRDTDLNYFFWTKSFVGNMDELARLIEQRLDSKSGCIMYKIRQNNDFNGPQDIQMKTLVALAQVLKGKAEEKKFRLMFNEAQGVGKILFV